ncbi:MAG: hypothetical protein OEX19_00060 [Gammaproteobacteria bacterium]|nr:hypothetical protein [Gammaproteobacteria bacterium]
MSLRLNLAANYVGQFWGVLLSIIMVPVYLEMLGLEAYAIVGLNTMVQNWLILLDVGLSATLSREMSRFRAGTIGLEESQLLCLTFEKIFLFLGLTTFLCFYLMSDAIATEWLTSYEIDVSVVSNCIVIMGAMAGCKWIAGIYRGALIGFEKHVMLNVFNVVIYTIRYVAVVPILMFKSSIELFLLFQLCTILFESLFLRYLALKNLKPFVGKKLFLFDFGLLQKRGKFAFTLSFTTIIWIVITQIDKLILSKYLSLKEFAVFSIITLVVSGITIMSGPLTQAIRPRLTYLYERQDISRFNETYFLATRFVSMVILSAAFVLIAMPHEVIWGWTGNMDIANQAADILPWYAAGHMIVAYLSITYLLQVAKGNVTLHLKGNILFAILFIPMLIYVASNFGMLGAAKAWFAVNLVFLLFWVPIVHRYFLPKMHFQWFVSSLVPYLVLLCLLTYLWETYGAEELTRFQSFVILLLGGSVFFSLSLLLGKKYLKPMYRLLSEK